MPSVIDPEDTRFRHENTKHENTKHAKFNNKASSFIPQVWIGCSG